MEPVEPLALTAIGLILALGPAPVLYNQRSRAPPPPPPPPQTAYRLGTPTVLGKPSSTSGATSPHTMCKLPVPIGATVYLFSVHTILSEVK